MAPLNRKITLSTCAFSPAPENSDTFVRYFEMAMEAGFDGFELGMPPEKNIPALLEAVCKTAAPVVAVHGIPRGKWLSGDPEEQEQAAEDSAKYLSYFTGFAPCPIVEHYIDRYNDPVPGRNFRTVMGLLLEKTEKMGFVFCMENAPYKPEYDERYPAVAEIAAFARSFGKNRMFMTFDLNHANLHEDPVAVCADCAGLVKHIHISDNHGFREEHLIPGQGTIDLGKIMAALYRNGYNGPWNLEFDFPRGEVPTVEKFREIRRGIATLLDQINDQQ